MTTDYFKEGHRVAARFLDPVIQQTHAQGEPAINLMSACLLSSYLAWKSVVGGTAEERKQSFINIAAGMADTLEQLTMPHA